MKLSKLLSKGKKMDEDKLISWVKDKLESGSNMEEIVKVLNKKYSKKEINTFLKKNYDIETSKKTDKVLDDGLEKENKKKKEFDKVTEEMNELISKAAGNEIKDSSPIEQVKSTPQITQQETTIEEKEEPKQEEQQRTIQKMSTYDIELLNLIASINQGITELVRLSSRK